ncbi:DUF1214 domain-containing protein [Parvibaculum sp.]|uniref:DUF1214 domain-containing protein n=1 Tax=Parvibaculum sp. TaxID=2024848 RepID=UPI001B0D2B60|nr:DUF1214 domain-containing protein [Parvibaculum sp.]MBO6633701.1 DUF1214 domain-containing protein [Parvibaculum sp.]MBO6678619.1 DUF1214 domain-containing protein [Parvibaculum sp.]MBO6685622.1 DUF1214 domain-containing protein [Parvibaculum sp.]MBO6904453.1 DUF1214 domain-containing protein [Parvibaculum sp.]
MKLAFKLVTVLIVALVLGAGSVILVLRAGGLGNEVTVGPWETSLVTGSSQADPYTRARVAIGGLLALNRSETIYFTAPRDDAGDTLRVSCSYKVIGSDLPARWWSITLYGEDHYLVSNLQDRYSFGGETVAREKDGSFVITVSPDETDGNWIPTGGGQNGDTFTLTLRLYNPDERAAQNPGGIVLPRIAKEACLS